LLFRHATPALRPTHTRFLAAALAVLAWVGGCAAVHAQAVVLQPTLKPATETDELASVFSDKPIMARRSLRESPTRDYQGLPVEGWMLYPSLFLGGLHDSNIFQNSDQTSLATSTTTSTRPVQGMAVNASPSILADRNRGVHRTEVFLDGDFSLYPNTPKGNRINAQAGIGHVWEAQRDLILKMGAEYDYLNNITATGYVRTPYGQALIGAPQFSSIMGGFASGVKSFDKIFVGVSGSLYDTTYQSLNTSLGNLPQSYRDNLLTTGTARVGYSFSPALYSFMEGTGNLRNYSSDTVMGLITPGVATPGTFYNSQGYRVVAGLGSDRISLFRGEIYGGYQAQNYLYGGFGTHSSLVYGGKLSWFPTRAWTVSLALDELFLDSSLPLYSNPLGSAAFVTQASAAVTYDISRQWNATIKGGYADYRYLSGNRRDRGLMGDFTFNYHISRGLMATANYSLNALNSTAVGGNYTRNLLKLGVTYKY
jgi:hypothetical protein